VFLEDLGYALKAAQSFTSKMECGKGGGKKFRQFTIVFFSKKSAFFSKFYLKTWILAYF
jgi:hypothetical protein